MRKVMGVTAALLLLAAGSVSAQTATGTVGATAEVLATLTATPGTDLNFGAGISPTVGSVTVATGTANVGSILITHTSEFSTDVTAVSANLLHDSGTGTTPLPVVFNCGYATTATGAIDGSETACTGLGNRTVNTLGVSQVSYLQVGGVLTVPANVEPGTYTGNISFLFTATGF